MTLFSGIAIFFIWLFALTMLVDTRQFLRQTNARAARRWAIASLLFLGFNCLVPSLPMLLSMSDGTQWYIAAILLLTPFISILGARHPTNKFWSYFVVLPMIFVLGFPVFVNWMGGAGAMYEDFSIQPPVLIGFLFVLMMGVGNYFGTALTFPAMLAGCSVVLIVVPLTTTVPHFFPAREMAFPAAVATHALSIIWAYWQVQQKSTAEVDSPYHQLWFDFQNLFGIVWSKQVADQVNQAAESNNWQVRLELHGLVWQQAELSAEQQSETIKGIDQQLRWALSRFVEEEWIERYLG